MQASPIKELAQSVGLAVEQPILSREIQAAMVGYQPDMAVVAAYGKIFRADLVNAYPFLNVHASLLPKYRGASPIQSAILNGDQETGVSIMLLSPGMDEGDILAQARCPIGLDQTAGDLQAELAQRGASLLIETLAEIETQGMAALRQPQDHAQARYCPKINSAAAEIPWNKTPAEIHNHIRAFSPWPGAYTFKQDLRIKILRSALKNGQLKILEVQPAGKSVMGYEAYLRGGYPALV